MVWIENGGIINSILDHDLWFKEYALAFSNLSRSSMRGARTPASSTVSFPAGTRKAGRRNTTAGNTREKSCRLHRPSIISTRPRASAPAANPYWQASAASGSDSPARKWPNSCRSALSRAAGRMPAAPPARSIGRERLSCAPPRASDRPRPAAIVGGPAASFPRARHRNSSETPRSRLLPGRAIRCRDPQLLVGGDAAADAEGKAAGLAQSVPI
jgi:hypothetical protein